MVQYLHFRILKLPLIAVGFYFLVYGVATHPEPLGLPHRAVIGGQICHNHERNYRMATYSELDNFEFLVHIWKFPKMGVLPNHSL